MGLLAPQHARNSIVEAGPLPQPTPTIQSEQTLIPTLNFDAKPLPLLELASLPMGGNSGNTYEWGNCTWYVASIKNVPETWGNANTWAYRAMDDGYGVSDTPVIGSVATSSAGYWGHVAVVSAISDGMVEVTEMNVFGLGVTDNHWYPLGYFDNYIYI